MKALQVIDKLDVGGSERVAVDLSIMLSENNKIQVSFLCLLNKSVLDDELNKNGIEISYLDRKNKYNPITILKMWKFFNKFDVVHLHSRQVLRYAGLLYLIPFKKKCKIIFHDHYGNIESDTHYSNYLKYCLKNVDAYIGVSSSLTNWATINNLNGKVFLLPNTIKKEKHFKPLNNCADIVVIGNFRPQKKYEFLCKLISKLPKTINVDIYASESDTNYYRKINLLIKELGIESRIKIIIGQTEISKVLKNYKLAVHTAASETGPLVAIEYLSQGLPIIMYRTGEVSKTLIKNNYSYILNNYDFNEWEKTIIDLLTNSEKLKNTSNKIKDIYSQNYSEEEYLKKCIKIYKIILKY